MNAAGGGFIADTFRMPPARAAGDHGIDLYGAWRSARAAVDQAPHGIPDDEFAVLQSKQWDIEWCIAQHPVRDLADVATKLRIICHGMQEQGGAGGYPTFAAFLADGDPEVWRTFMVLSDVERLLGWPQSYDVPPAE
ncbi:MAG TPA: hypothetical protein VKS60_02075 [Stellaceae bacterium]|nr:hypothetical protein [Stellaceae bacterium]